jgi:hypothetical protein
MPEPKRSALWALLLPLWLAIGCQQGADVNTANRVDDPTPSITVPQTKVEPVPPAIDWSARLDQAVASLDSGQLEAVAKLIDEAEKARAAGNLNQENVAGLTKLQEAYGARKRQVEEKTRQALLAQAESSLKDGDLAAASRALDNLLSAGPSEPQRQAARKLRERVESTRKTRRELESQFRLLASSNRADVRAARSRLLEAPDVSLPMLLEATRSDNPALVSNALEALGYFSEPQRTVPAIVAVLASAQHEPCWPAAIREIGKLKHPGAGEPLLKLALSVNDPKQRTAVLTALAAANDPPPSTLVSLLPLVQADGPALPLVLSAAYQGAAKHRFSDLLSRRGLPQLSSEQDQWLTALPERLRAIVAADTKNGELGETARAAMILGVATGIMEAQPFKGAKVVRPSEKEAQAAADGQWNSIDAAHMWQHPLTGRPHLVLDLGAERTVSGVRIWNYNLPGAAVRGWKEVDIFVSLEPALLEPVAKGQVPPAPAAATGADYSITLAVPFVRGRYVKLEPRSCWQNDGYGGVTEVEVVGF